MASTSTSGQSPFGFGRKKKAPGLLDQIGKFFGVDRRRRGKVSSPRPKSRWRELLGLGDSKSAARETARSPRRRCKEQNTLSRIFNRGEGRSRSPPKRWSTIF